MFSFASIRRRRLRRKPFPDAWRALLEKNVALYRRLPPEDRDELHGHVQVFLAEKHFEGCAGVRITDEIRVTIAAQACILLLHRPTDYYPSLTSILVYPHEYFAPVRDRDVSGIVTEELEDRLGESWSDGVVVLAWDEVRAGAADLDDGRNLVFHEFAHQLDGEDGDEPDGVVPLPQPSRVKAWARILGREYVRLQRETARGRSTLLDAYGATSPSEFFAVATELFFEKPVPFKARHPELYEELKAYYRQDPVRYAAQE